MRLAFLIISLAFCFGRTYAQSSETVPQGTVISQEQVEKLAADSSRPQITLKQALKVAEAYIRKERISLRAHYLAEAKLIGYGDDKFMKERHWSFRWVQYHMAGDPEVVIIVSMEGKALRRLSANDAFNIRCTRPPIKRSSKDIKMQAAG